MINRSFNLNNPLIVLNIIIIIYNLNINICLNHFICLLINPCPIVLPNGGGGNLSCSFGSFAEIILSLGAFFCNNVLLLKIETFSSYLFNWVYLPALVAPKIDYYWMAMASLIWLTVILFLVMEIGLLVMGLSFLLIRYSLAFGNSMGNII